MGQLMQITGKSRKGLLSLVRHKSQLEIKVKLIHGKISTKFELCTTVTFWIIAAPYIITSYVKRLTIRTSIKAEKF